MKTNTIPRFKVGERVRLAADTYATVTAIVPGKVTRYRLTGHRFMYFEYDLERTA